MITRGTAFLTRIRRWLSPTEWFVKWFRLPKDEATSHSRGLVLIQIDGLSRAELKTATEGGRMPFLASLLNREQYVVHDLYSGLPASTPAVQGELFYGTRCAVPAFGFRDHRTGNLVRMFARDITSDVERRLSQKQRGLLSNGSAYCNIYSGGADEAHFCASSMGWSDLMKRVNNWKLVPFLLWHSWSVLRVIALLVVEFVLACLSFIKGAITRHEYWQELLMIPARVVVVILLRELTTAGASMDVARGLPIVQLNLLGYDEQAHRRGPHSAFAHWTLKGIDRGIRKLWLAAHRSAHREYDVWIYSDHGQIATTAFEYETGEELADLTAAVVNEVVPLQADTPGSERKQKRLATLSSKSDGSPERADSRAHWLSAAWIVGKLFGEGKHDLHDGTHGAQVAALGPLGLLYLNRDLTDEQRFNVAERLVQRGVPLAFVATPNTTLAFRKDGRFDLKSDPAAIFGADHPFLSEVANDTLRLCNHPDAGDIVVSGWVCNDGKRRGESLSFAVQSGAHAGPSPEETHAFVMAPRDVHLENPKGVSQAQRSASRGREIPASRSAATCEQHVVAPVPSTTRDDLQRPWLRRNGRTT